MRAPLGAISTVTIQQGQFPIYTTIKHSSRSPSLTSSRICVECLVDQIRSDNGPQYASAHFTAFCKSWGIEHVTSSPNYAQSNGFAERQVRWVKPVINKWLKTSETRPIYHRHYSRCELPQSTRTYHLRPSCF